MESLKEYLRLYPAETGKISKESKRIQHIVDDLKSYSNLEVESKEVYDDFMNNLKQLNLLSKKIKIGKEGWYAKKS